MKTLKQIQFFLALGFLLTLSVTYKPVVEIFFPLYSSVQLSRLFAFPLLLVTALLIVQSPKKEWRIPKVHQYYLGFLGVLLLTLAFSLAPKLSFKYFLPVIFGFLVSFSLYHTFRGRPFYVFISALLAGLILTSAIAVLNLVLSNLGIQPYWGEFRTDAAIGLFARFHEAGIYALTLWLMFLAVLFQRESLRTQPNRILLFSGVFLGSFLLLASGRVSNMVGLAAALVGYLIFFRNKAALKKVMLTTALLAAQLLLMLLMFKNVFNRIAYRVQSRLLDRVPGTPEADFVVDNFQNTLNALADHPLTGTGLGAYQHFYGSPTLHGTFLRIAGEAGLLGLSAFILFLIFTFWLLRKKLKENSATPKDWLFHFFPLLLGLIVSWMYNYELTNPVFWILFAVLAVSLEQNTKKITNN